MYSLSFITATAPTFHLFLRLEPDVFVSAVDDDDEPASDCCRLLLFCPLELVVSCDVSAISSANNLCLRWSKGCTCTKSPRKLEETENFRNTGNLLIWYTKITSSSTVKLLPKNRFLQTGAFSGESISRVRGETKRFSRKQEFEIASSTMYLPVLSHNKRRITRKR